MSLCSPQSGVLAGCVSLHLGDYPLSLVSKQFLLSVEPRNLGGARTAALLRQLHRLQRRLNLLKRHSLYSNHIYHIGSPSIFLSVINFNGLLSIYQIDSHA